MVILNRLLSFLIYRSSIFPLFLSFEVDNARESLFEQLGELGPSAKGKRGDF